MDNPLSKLAPQLFGQYPKPFIKLFDTITTAPGQDIDKIKDLLNQLS